MIKVLDSKGKEIYVINYFSAEGAIPETQQSKIMQNKVCNVIFAEKNDSHDAWNDMLIRIQIEKKKSPERPVTIQVYSLKELNSRDEKQFNQMLGDVLKYGASLYSVSDDIVYTPKYPRGLCKHSGDTQKAMNNLRSEWKKEKVMKGIPLNNGKNLTLKESLTRKTVEI